MIEVNAKCVKLAEPSALYKVYHIAPAGCTDLAEGYVGVTRQTLKHRMLQHRTSTRPVGQHLRNCPTAVIREIARLPLQQALEMEHRLRPDMNIGWNVLAGGGVRTSVCTGCGKPLPHRGRGYRCMQCNPSRFRKGQEAHNAGVQQYVLTDPSGAEHHVANLTTFCAKHGITRENIRKVARGTRSHAKGWKARFV